MIDKNLFESINSFISPVSSFSFVLACCLSVVLIFKYHLESEKIVCNHLPKRTKQIWCQLCSSSAMFFLFSHSKILLFYFSIHHFLQLSGRYRCFLGKFYFLILIADFLKKFIIFCEKP